MGERETQMYLNFEQPRVMERVFAKMDKEILESLTPKQKQALGRAITRSFLQPSNKLVDLRVTLPFPRRRFYGVFYLGTDTRADEPRYFCRHLSRTRWTGNLVFLVLLTGFSLFALIGLASVIQRLLGVSIW
jgi:hypothetical protein